MKKETELMVSVAGVVLAFFELLRKKLEQAGRGFEVIHFLVTPQGEPTVQKIVDLLVEAVPIMVGTLKCLTAFRMQISGAERTNVAEYLAVGVNRIVYCDSSVTLLGGVSLAMDGGESKVFELTNPNGTQFREAVSFVTNETGSDSKRQEVLLAQGRVFSPAQVGVLLGKAQKVEGRVDCPVTGLLMNGRANLLPVLAQDNSVSLLSAHWSDDGWSVYVRGFGFVSRWNAVDRVLFRN